MAKFRVLSQSFIGNKLVEAGAIVDINTDVKKGGMKPGKNLEPVKGNGSAEVVEVAEGAEEGAEVTETTETSKTK